MKRLLVTSIILCTLLSMYGQQKMRFSVHADPQFAWFSSDENNITPNGSVLYFQTGLQMDLFFAENYAFSLGFGINTMGGNLLYSDSTEFISRGDTLLAVPGQIIKHKLQYLDFPIGLKLKTEELGYATFFFQLGFNPMVNINASATSKDETFDKENIQESTNLFNLGYHVGAGVEYRLGGSTSAIGGIRWSSGLTDVTSNDKANVTLNAISIHLGILF
ncbi:MAG: PorT family protein [Bacteroidales bacterium]|nr:PorT family protein [Bacteroidales bacterium]